MGTRSTTYILVGIRLSLKEEHLRFSAHDDECYEYYEKYLDNRYQNNIKSHNGITAIYDGMGGKYLYLGEVVARSDMDYSCLDEGELDVSDLHIYKDRVSTNLANEFGLRFDPLQIKLHYFTHVS